jgi:predicted O-methyltransferase YrrM
MTNILDKIHRRIFSGLARKDHLDHLYDQVAGLLQIQNAMAGQPVLRPMRGWAISPDAMALVLVDLQEREAPTVIEFGSGQSTIILASALRHRGGKLVSVEHDVDYSAVIRKQLDVCGLADVVLSVHLPIEASTDPQEVGIRSYDLRALPSQKVDIALIDGPPKRVGSVDTRLVPLRWCVKNLTERGAIFLDDSNRPSEQQCLAALRREFPGILLTEVPTEKGLTRIQRAG